MLKKLTKRVIAGTIGVGAIAGTVGAVVACGSTSYERRLYYETPVSYQVTTSLSGDQALTLWVPYNLDTDKTKDVSSDVTKAIQAAIEKAGMKITTLKGDAEGVGYTSAASTWNKAISVKEYKTLPDIVINYPDFQAVVATNGLAYSFGTEEDMKKIITPTLFSDATSVFAKEEGIFALPLLKSTELTYFDLVNFARLFKDIAAQKSTANDEFTVPANSAQDRMIKMITATPGTSNAISGIYSPTTSTDGKVTYKWSVLAQKWSDKTASGAVWEKDAQTLNANYTLSETGKAALLDIAWDKAIFTSYDEVLNFIRLVKKAYTTKNDVYVGGIDSTANILYSYDFQKSDSDPSKFFTRISTENNAKVLQYDFRETVDGVRSPLYDAAQYMSDLVASGGVVARDLTASVSTRVTTLLSKHQLFFAWESTSSTSRPISTDAANTNAGEIYYDLQPTKTALSQTKQAVINQGPSILVTTVHGKEAAKKIADAIIAAYKPGGELMASWNATTKTDDGPLGKGGYMYANKTDNESGSALKLGLDTQIQSSANWGVSIGKYLMSKFFSEAAEDTNKSAFVNPAGPSSSLARRTFDGVFVPAFLNNAPSDGVSLIQRVINTLVPDGKLK